MAAAKRDKRRADIAKLLDVYRGIGAPAGTPSQRALWMILAHHGTRDGATRAFHAMWKRFLDINEFRVTKPVEIAEVVRAHVKNDPIRVAMRLRGFLRRFFRDYHDVDFLQARSLTPDGLRRYLAGLDDHAREMGLALFFNFCANEIAMQESEAAEEGGDGKPRKRGEREVASDLDRMRMACAFAVHGESPSKAKLNTAHRRLLKAWAYAPLPEPAPPRARKRKVAKRKTAPKKKKTTGKKKTSTRGGGKARPRTTRATRKRVSKKSSRR